MSEFLKAVQTAHEAHEKTLQHHIAVEWGNTARARLDAHYRKQRKARAA